MSNHVVWFEINTVGDPGRVQDFYRRVFGWKIDTGRRGPYGLVQPQGDGEAQGIGGGIGPTDADHGYVTIYVGVDDIEATLRTVEAAGGRVAMPPTHVPGGPVVAQFDDPDGNRIGIVKNGS